MSKNQNEISNTLYKALNHQYNSDYLTAKSAVLSYFTFSNIENDNDNENNVNLTSYEKIDKLIEKMHNAKSKLKMLEDTYKIAKVLNQEPEYRSASP